MTPSRSATAVAGAIAIAIAAGMGYGLHQSAKKRAEERALVAVVGQTTAQLKAALKTPSALALESIEEKLKIPATWSNPYMADAAEQYLVGAREIVRRRAEVVRLSKKAAESRAALASHMRRAARRDGEWIRIASDLKRQVERDHFDLDVALKALASLLDALPDAQKRLDPYVEASLVLDDTLRRQAREQALAEAKRAGEELERVRALAPRF